MYLHSCNNFPQVHRIYMDKWSVAMNRMMGYLHSQQEIEYHFQCASCLDTKSWCTRSQTQEYFDSNNLE